MNKLFHKKKHDASGSSASTVNGSPSRNTIDHISEKQSTPVADDATLSKKVPTLTLKTFFMTILIAMGGFIFGS